MPDKTIDERLASITADLDAYQKKIRAAMKALKAKDAAWSDVTGALRMIADFRGKIHRMESQIQEQRERAESSEPETADDPLDLKLIG